MKYYVIDDEKTTAREAFVADEEMSDRCFDSYSGYYTVCTFETESTAVDYCEKYNAYKLDTDKPVECNCCSRGCTMSAWEYGHWNGCCAYEGQFEENEEE